MQDKNNGSPRGWEREEAFRRTKRRLLFTFLLLTLIGGLLLGLILEKTKEETITRVGYLLRTDAEELSVVPRVFVERINGVIHAFAGEIDNALTAPGGGEVQPDDYVYPFLLANSYLQAVWFAYPSEESGEEIVRVFSLEGGTPTEHAADEARYPISPRLFENVPATGEPAVIRAVSGDYQNSGDEVILSFGARLRSGKGRIGVEYPVPLNTLFVAYDFMPRPLVMLLSRDGTYFGLRWNKRFVGTGPAADFPEVAVALDAMQGDRAEWDSLRTYKDAAGSESILYCRNIGYEGESRLSDWWLVTTFPAEGVFREAREFGYLIFGFGWLMLAIVFLIVYAVKRRRYTMPEKVSTPADLPNKDEALVLTPDQQERFKAMGRKRTMYRVLMALFFIPAILFVAGAEKRFKKASADGDVAAAEIEIQKMQKAAIVAVLIGIPILILNVYLEFFA